MFTHSLCFFFILLLYASSLCSFFMLLLYGFSISSHKFTKRWWRDSKYKLGLHKAIFFFFIPIHHSPSSSSSSVLSFVLLFFLLNKNVGVMSAAKTATINEEDFEGIDNIHSSSIICLSSLYIFCTPLHCPYCWKRKWINVHFCNKWEIAIEDIVLPLLIFQLFLQHIPSLLCLSSLLCILILSPYHIMLNLNK